MKAGTKTFVLEILPDREDLEEAIAANGQCDPKNCWHRVAITKKMQDFGVDTNYHVRIDAGHIKLNYKGYRYVADTPLHVKRSLMLFDDDKYDLVRIRKYRLKFRRTTKIVETTPERREQINDNRRRREREGRPDRTDYNLRARVAGFSGIV